LLKVKTCIGQSRIHGIGLFAAEDVPAGTVIWQIEPPFDVFFDRESFELLTEIAKEHVDKYSYWSPEHQAYVLCGDDARFMNHSDEPNTSEGCDRCTVAVRDIAAGEELTCSYHELAPGPFGHGGFLEPAEAAGAVLERAAGPEAEVLCPCGNRRLARTAA
jgi:hypothetical protein